ncbi:hypothetical protein ACFVWR_10335 [Leifsonia sp. NPDC058292]|uniref:hypothetical protein n=1 Tax=Leifsonia sp. NPDC058292 TaxID=3346428 RepID=UPI0036DE1431
MSDTTPASPVGTGLSRGWRYLSVGAIWALALVLAVVIATVSAPEQYASWLSLALAACVVGGLCAQLATQQKEGFVNRLAASVSGAFVVLGVAGAVLGIVAAA